MFSLYMFACCFIDGHRSSHLVMQIIRNWSTAITDWIIFILEVTFHNYTSILNQQENNDTDINQEPTSYKKASIRWQDSARRQFQAGLRGDVGH